MRKAAKLTVDKEERERMMASIKVFYRDVREEEIGDLAARLLLDFVIEHLAPKFYNQGVEDSYRYMQERVEDLLSIEK